MTSRVDVPSHPAPRRDRLPLAALRALAPLGLPGLLALHRQRRDLAELDARLLRDIGLTREAAAQEATRPLWDVPATWLR